MLFPQRRHKEAVEAYKASLSRAVIEQKTADYIADKTISGLDIVDPTGSAFRVEPSQVTSIQTKKFGLGVVAKERPDVLNAVSAAGYAMVFFTLHFVPPLP